MIVILWLVRGHYNSDKENQRNTLAKQSFSHSSLPLSYSELPCAGRQNDQQMLVTLRKKFQRIIF